MKYDEKFLKWVDMVAATESDAVKLQAVPWADVLQVLFQIFQILSAMGCFAASRATARAKKIMNGGLVGCLAKLESFRDELVVKYPNKGVK